jgi:hypothetical protein
VKIVVRQMSGLGNQMFQYAAGLYYAQKYHAELEIAINPIGQTEADGFPRPYQLSQFRITIPARKLGPLDRLMQTRDPRMKPVAAVLCKLLQADLVEEPVPYRFHSELPRRTRANRVHLRGYWQASRYAETLAARLRSELVLRNPASGRNADVLRMIKNSRNPVSLHVRRGDYLLAKGGNLALSRDYYHAAVRSIQNHMAAPSFFVFSDDIIFAREYLPSGVHAIFVDHNDAWTGYEDLRLMSACAHNIIANSSFSWWGAWLNLNREKIVVAPKYWLCNSQSYYPDLFPRDWTLLNNL